MAGNNLGKEFAPNYKEPGACCCCIHGDYWISNPYSFFCKKYPTYAVEEFGVCDDFIEDAELEQDECEGGVK
jgi:hypothetical protein